MKLGRFNEVVPLLLRFAVSCQNCKATASMRKAYLGSVVVALYMEVRSLSDNRQLLLSLITLLVCIVRR